MNFIDFIYNFFLYIYFFIHCFLVSGFIFTYIIHLQCHINARSPYAQKTSVVAFLQISRGNREPLKISLATLEAYLCMIVAIERIYNRTIRYLAYD